MASNIKNKEDIVSSIAAIVTENKEVSWSDFLLHAQELIIESYVGENITLYKGKWKSRFKIQAKSMNYTIIPDRNDRWPDIQRILIGTDAADSQSPKSITSKASSDSNYLLSSKEKERVIQLYNDIKAEDSWILTSGTVVEDKMRRLVEDSVYEHPVHSLIMDPHDPIWKSYFTQEELEEIASFKRHSLKSIPASLSQYLSSYDKQFTAKELFKYAHECVFDPIEEHDKKWIQQSMIHASELFLYRDTLYPNNYSEADVTHNVWSFLYRLFSDDHIEARLGEICSAASSLARNKNRALEVIEKRSRKIMGARMDILFERGAMELGCCEIGKDDVKHVDDKYLNDGLVKLPKSLKDILCVLVNYNQSQINNISAVGLLVMGLQMELIIMDIPVGKSIARIIKTSPLHFPSTIETITTDMIPLLEVTWKAKEAMKNTFSLMMKREREVSIMAIQPRCPFKPSFQRI
ncbi:hypothetical protein BDB01DRAFT_331714 [Pilobolus umbonatus]|nr:hypothetical protein BDB01DRAFT_331714 [Pilobolus umbonatus]